MSYNAPGFGGGAMATAGAAKSVLRFGVFELNAVTGELRKAGMTIRLRPQAAKVLTILVERGGELVSREELRQQIWGRETFVDFEHSLNLCVREIRAALDDDADSPRFVETLPRRGYRFIAPLEKPVPLTKPAWSRWVVVPALLVIICVVLGMVAPTQWRERMLGTSGDPVHTIAVLPLQNLSGDAAQDYFADGITETLTTDLARMESLQVISRTSTMQYKTTKKTLPAIARDLKADAIVEGSVQLSGNRVRITAQLVRAATDNHLWAETYERDLKDILPLQDEIASSIAQEIETRLGGPKPAEPTKTTDVSAEAYETYLRANYYLDKFDLQKSIEYYNQAIKLAPNYAPIYAHMANSYFFLGFFNSLPPRGAWGKVKEAGTLAVEKDDRLPEAHGALALAKLHYDWDFAGAEAEFKRALQLNPNDADIRHEYAHYLMAMGRMAESQAESQRAVELDPMGDGLNSCLCWHSFAARDYEESERLAKHYLASQPDDPWEHTILGWTYEQLRMPDEAITELKKTVEITKGDSFFLAALGNAYGAAGRRTDAEQVLQTLMDRSKKSYVSPFDIALIYASLGEKDSAFTWLNKAANERSTFLIYSKWEPRLDPLRSDPRFAKLLKQIGLAT
ncbi:MAG TPA: tetratricopeptide repeat protein [Terriglobales bacterium]|nr:tetratricopeptide repeat protein [Terriglobales bacterium]